MREATRGRCAARKGRRPDRVWRWGRLLVLALAACTAVERSGEAAATVEPCAVTGQVPEPERESALEDCRFARSRYALLFGEDAPGADIELADTTYFAVSLSTGRVRVGWYRESALALDAAAADAMEEMMGRDHVITHELLHSFFWLRSGDPADIETATRYGTRRPDWFDEGVAVWGERDGIRLRRWEILASLPDSVLDLRRLAAEAHPTLAGQDREDGFTATTIRYPFRCAVDDCGVEDGPPEGFVIRTRTRAAGGTVVDTVPESLIRPASGIARHFYPLSYGLVRYLHDRGGSDAILEVNRRFDGGWPSADSVFAGIPGLPPGLDAIEADWRRWVRSREPG